METKKTIEEKIALRFVTNDEFFTAVKNYKKTNKLISGLEDTTKLGNYFFNELMANYPNEIAKLSNGYAVDLTKLRKEVTKKMKPFLTEYVENQVIPKKEIKLRI